MKETRAKRIIKKVPPLFLLGKRLRFQYRAAKGSLKVRKAVKSTTNLRIIVGALNKFDDGWIPTNIEYLNLLRAEHWQRYFQKNSITAILAEHVWEHLTLQEGGIAAQNCYDYLKTGGYLRVAVPDGFHPDPEYIEWVKIGGIGPSADDHKILYTYETFSELFKKAGFEVRLLEYFDQAGKFHFVDWDPADGMIHRSKRFDGRNKGGDLNYTSLILDAHKNI